MYYVYVLQNPDGTLYKGYTSNLDERIRYHNSGWSRSTKKRGPWRLVYVEQVVTKTEALKRERFLKSGKGRDFIKKKVASALSS